MSRDQVITGTAMRTAVGRTRDETFEALCRGHSGLAPLVAFPEASLKSRHGYEILDREPPDHDRTGRASEWLVEVISAALGDAGLDGASEQWPVLVGTGLRESRSVELWWREGFALVPAQTDFAGAVRAGVRQAGQVHTFTNACSASSFALGLAEDILASGESEIVIVAGADAITETMHGLADRANPATSSALRPFDTDRQGVLLGEGAAALVLESRAHAERRGARVRGVLRGVGLNCDAGHETAPDREQVGRAMRMSHERAGIRAEEIDLVLAHGTGTALNDDNEANALSDVFGEHVGHFLVTATKSMTGHTSGASGLMGVITALACFEHRRVPPTVGLDNPLAAARNLDLVTESARQCAPRLAQVDAFGFGGVNAVAIVEAPKP